jgi:predicted YcjX-like family ATPase
LKTVRIAITGLKEAGKTVFLTSLINHLLEGSEETLPAFKDDAVTFSAVEVPPRHDQVHFPYYRYLDELRQEEPRWPERTWDVSHFRVALTVRNLRRRRTHELLLEFVDYSGERLLDMPLLSRDYELWSDEVTREAETGLKKDLSTEWFARCAAIKPEAAAEDAAVVATVEEYEKYLGAVLLEHIGVRAASPGFSPLPQAAQRRAPEVAREFRRRYDDYVRDQVKPFFHQVGRCSRQIVLVDVLRVLREGVHSYNDTRRSVRQILDAYAYARMRHRLSLMRILDLFTERIDRVVFVASKADQCTRATRGNLRLLLEDLVDQKRRQLVTTLPHGRPRVMFCAANRSTEDACKQFDGRELSCLRGIREDGEPDRDGPWFPGEVPPEWPDDAWNPDEEQYRFPNFRPRRVPMRDAAVIRHINLDRVFHYMIEDLIE